MKRRAFIAGLGSAAAWPVAAFAQQPTMPVIGLVGSGTANWSLPLSAFRQGLNDARYIEGRNVAIEYRWAEGHYDQLPALMSDLLDRKSTVIVALGNVAARAAKKATATVPIVFASGSDPVAIGLVNSLSRPGTNLTGVSILNNELESKRFELLIEVIPDATLIAFLVNPDSPTTAMKSSNVQAAAHDLNRQLLIVNARNARELEATFESSARQHVQGLIRLGQYIRKPIS